jgi:hypothetical protein
MSSPNLAITHVAAAQNQKEVTINDAIDALDGATQGVLSLDFTSGHLSLSDAQFRGAFVLKATGVSAARDLAVPAIQRLFAVNNIAGTAAVTVKRGAAAIEVAAGAVTLFHTDGSTNGLASLGGSAASARTYLLSGAVTGKPSAGARVFHHLAGVAFTLPENLGDSIAIAKAAATAEADFDIKAAGASVGTIRFAAAGTTASFIFAAPVSVAAGDEIEIIAPAVADATLADITWTIKGTA